MILIDHPQSSEIDAVFAFMNALDTLEFGVADSSREDLEGDWEQLDLGRDAWAVRKEGKICGFASLRGANGRFMLDLYVHEVLTPPGWSDQLLIAGENRLVQLKQKDLNHDMYQLTVYASSVNSETNAILARKGYEVHSWHYRMQIDFSDQVDPVGWPEGFVVREFRQDDEAELYQLIQSTFDWGDRVTTPLETWRRLLFRGGRYEPELFMLVRKEGRLVGAALCYDESPTGWIRQLAIAKELQGQGYGSMLLRHAFHAFSQRGLTSAGLGVASVNQKACLFYERCGMSKTREFVEYRKKV